jgi:hypothetical protein
MQGTLTGTDSWFHNPQAQASAHFGVGNDGTVFQWVDTSDTAWHCGNGNGYTIGIEHEGWSGEKLSNAQIEASGKIFAWAHVNHPVPLQLTNNPSGKGLGWHGMGGASWSNHPDCPGQPIVNQLPDILSVATGAPIGDEDVPVLCFYMTYDQNIRNLPITLPNDVADGNHRIGFGCPEQGAELDVDTKGFGTKSVTGFSGGRQGFAIPKGCTYMVAKRRDSGNVPISVSVGKSS